MKDGKEEGKEMKSEKKCVYAHERIIFKPETCPLLPLPMCSIISMLCS